MLLIIGNSLFYTVRPVVTVLSWSRPKQLLLDLRYKECSGRLSESDAFTAHSIQDMSNTVKSDYCNL